MDATTENLAKYALSVNYDEISADVIAGAKLRILDTLGCIAGAIDHPVSKSVCRMARRYSMETPATIFATGEKTSPEMAAFANSVMLRVLDLSDSYRVKSGGHPSDLLGASFAAAEIADATGKELIAAIALGYEVYCSFTETIDVNTKGWDQPIYGIVASAVSAGKLLRLDCEQLTHAIALALVPNMATFQTREGELSAWKGCAGANAARNGLFAALLAMEGFTGPEKPVEGKYGLWDVIGKFQWPLQPGEAPYRIAITNLKAFPICYQGQTAVWTALGMRDRFSVDAIKNIHVDTYLKAFTMMGSDPNRWAPRTRETADHSMPYVVGTAFLYGDVGEAAFTDEALQSPNIKALMPRITVAEDPALTEAHPEQVPCRMTVTLNDGSKHVHELPYPKGHTKHPMSADEVTNKFHRLYAIYGSTAQADRVIDTVNSLNCSKTIMPLFETFHKSSI